MSLHHHHDPSSTVVDPYVYLATLMLMLNHSDNSRPISIHSHTTQVSVDLLSLWASSLAALDVVDERMGSRMMMDQRLVVGRSRRRHIDMDDCCVVGVVGDHFCNQMMRIVDVALMEMRMRWMLDLDLGYGYDLEVDRSRTLYMLTCWLPGCPLFPSRVGFTRQSFS
jgi:hypothetical protein